MKSNPPFQSLVLLSVLAHLCLQSARAHTLPISYLTILPDSERVHLELMLNPFELNFFSELDQNKNGQLEPRELAVQEQLVTRRLVESLKLRVGGKLIAPEVAGVFADGDSHHLILRAHYRIDARKAPLVIEFSLADLTSGSHITQVNYGLAHEAQAARLDMQTRTATFNPIERAEPAPLSIPATNSIAFTTLLFVVILPGLALVLALAWIVSRHLRHLKPSPTPDSL